MSETPQVEDKSSYKSKDGTSDQSEKSEKPKSKFVSAYLPVISKLLQSYVKLLALYLGILSIYWGALYHREDRFRNLKMLLVTEDSSFQANSDNVPPLIGDSLSFMLTHNLSAIGDWHVISPSEFEISARKHNNNISQEIQRQVHHQQYWVAIHVAPNSTQTIYNSMALANYSDTQAFSSLINVYYESGRHFSALNQYITKNIYRTYFEWVANFTSPYVYDKLVTHLNDTQRANLVSSNNSVTILTTPPEFNLINMRTSTSAAVMGPSELGLVYLMLFSFHQFNFSLEIYTYMRATLKFRHFLVGRIVAAQLNAACLALVYSLITLAFQVPIDVAFGKSGFLVLWAFVYLYTSACGGISELVAGVIFASGQRVLVAPWMVFNLVINMATTFAPLALSPGFYRYGKAMPMYNIYNALKPVFFNTWKGTLGLNIGILVAWIFVTNILNFLFSTWNTNRIKKKAKLQEEQKKKESEKQNQEDSNITNK